MQNDYRTASHALYSRQKNSNLIVVFTWCVVMKSSQKFICWITGLRSFNQSHPIQSACDNSDNIHWLVCEHYFIQDNFICQLKGCIQPYIKIVKVDTHTHTVQNYDNGKSGLPVTSSIVLIHNNTFLFVNYSVIPETYALAYNAVQVIYKFCFS